MSVSKTFTDGDDLFNVNSEDDYSLNFLGGNDRLTTYKGTTTALMGDGDDRVVIRGGTVTADGEAGNDRFDFLADRSGVSLTGGAGADSFFGNGHSISGSIYGGDGDDSFYNFGRVGGQSVSLYGGVGNCTASAPAFRRQSSNMRMRASIPYR
jgi:Ca2+-binding RTX toxin-like protein